MQMSKLAISMLVELLLNFPFWSDCSSVILKLITEFMVTDTLLYTGLFGFKS